MAKQTQATRQATERTSEEATQEVADTSEADEIKELTDDLLAEIDSVLEENAEEFVRQYVQKGGE